MNVDKGRFPIIQDNSSSVVAFRLDQRTFAMPLDVIVQILPMMTITPIPHLSKIIKGTINVRGKDILVISLRSHFGVAEEELQLYTPLLLLNLHDRLLALIVDSVLDVMTLPMEKVTSLHNIMPDGIEDNPTLRVRGISQYNDEAVLVLDPDNLFYNQQSVIQNYLETGTGVDEHTPVLKNTPIEEDIPVPVPSDRHLAKSKRIPAVKRTHAAKSIPVVEDMPIAESVSVAEITPPVELESAPAVEEAPAPAPSLEHTPEEDK